jgi:hypothetical protein
VIELFDDPLTCTTLVPFDALRGRTQSRGSRGVSGSGVSASVRVLGVNHDPRCSEQEPARCTGAGLALGAALDSAEAIGQEQVAGRLSSALPDLDGPNTPPGEIVTV